MPFRTTHPRWRRSALLVGIFALSRVGYAYLGVTPDDSVLQNGYMQILSTDLLQHHLLDALLRLHSQPPMMNALVGLALKSRPHAPLLIHALMSLSSLACVFGVARLTRELGASRAVALAVAAVFAVNPATVLYESWFFYTSLTCTWLTWSAASWLRFRRTRRWRDGVVWSLATLLATFTWALFHVAWVALVGLLLLRRTRGRGAVVVAVTLLVGVAPYVKNLVLVDRFAMSTWDGMNVMRIASHERTSRDLKRLLPRDPIAKVEPFAAPARYGKAFPATCGSVDPHPALCNPYKKKSRRSAEAAPNFNHVFYAEASRHYRDVALALIWRYPATYRRSVALSVTRFWTPPGDYSFLTSNRSRIPFYELATHVLHGAAGEIAGALSSSETQLRARVTWGSLALFGLGSVTLVSGVFSRHRRARDLAVGRVVGVVLFMGPALASCLVEIGENERFRFTFEGLIGSVGAVGLFAVAQAARRALHRRAARRKLAPLVRPCDAP